MADRFRRNTQDYRVLASAKLRSDWQYRISFLAFVLVMALLTASDFIGIAVIFTNTESLGDWSFIQVAFLYGVAGSASGWLIFWSEE